MKHTSISTVKALQAKQAVQAQILQGCKQMNVFCESRFNFDQCHSEPVEEQQFINQLVILKQAQDDIELIRRKKNMVNS